ncbi:MAG: hypothetical protein JXA24_02125 [Proteobacteria bacterium]|nr:hypothetical protein [Pseudomonadota bacterium]
MSTTTRRSATAFGPAEAKAGKNTGFSTRTTGELLVVARDTSTNYTNITTPLTRNNINLECFTTYKWGSETAFRMVTNDNRKAREVLRSAGYEVQETPVTLWYTRNEPGRFNKAADALTKARIDTYCTYSTAVPDSNLMLIAFDTNDANRTSEVLSRIK